jgi:hypothetical protein
MSTSEGLSTSRSRDSQSHQWRLVVDGNVAYHLTHNVGKSWKIQEKVRVLGNSGKPVTLETLSLTKFSKHVFQEQ